MTTTHDFMPGPAFQFPSQTLYDVHETTKKANAIKNDALHIEKGLSKLDIPEYPTITPQVKEMKEKATNLIEKSDSLICDMEIMRQRIENETKETDQLKITLNELNILKITVEKLKSRCEILELENVKLTDGMKKLEESKNIIRLAQATWLFERYTAMFVLPQTEKIGLLGCFKHMEEFISKETNNEEEEKKREESNERWEQILTINKVKWTERHWKAIKVLRKPRLPKAHPQVDFHEAKNDIANITPQNTKECLEILKMVETLNSAMWLGCLVCKLQVLKNTAKKRKASDAATQWEKLTSEIEWSPDHDKALIEMTKLKGNAKKKDLQKVDLEEAKKHLNGYVPDELLQQCFGIVDILKNTPLQ